MREELEALQAAFATEREKSSALEDEVRTAQAALASRLDDTNTSENIVDRPFVFTPARHIDKFRGQPLKPDYATIYEWVSDARSLFRQPHSSYQRQVRLPYLLIIWVVGHARKLIDTSSCPEAIFKVLLTVFGDGDLFWRENSIVNDHYISEAPFKS